MTQDRLLLAVLTAITAFSQVASAQTGPSIEVREGTASVSRGKAPFVQVTDYEDNVVAKIPIDVNPKDYVYSKALDTIYVVHQEKGWRNTISAVNIGARQVAKRVPVEAGFPEKLQLSRDESKLYFCAGSTRDIAAPSVTVIDTKTNTVISTKTWADGFLSRIPGKHERLFGSSFIGGTSDGSVAVVSTALRGEKVLLRELETFTAQGSEPASTSKLGDWPSAWMFSKDEALLFAAVKAGKYAPGSLQVFAMAKGLVANRTMIESPLRLFRLGSDNQPWVLSAREMRTISETGEPGDKRIPLAKAGDGGTVGNPEGDSLFLDGYPGETISVGRDYAAVLIVNKNGTSGHRVALIDMKHLKIDAVIPTMSGTEIAGIRTTRTLAAFALSMATAGAVIFIPNLTMRNESLASGPDGHHLYALDVEGHVLMVVDVDTSKVVTRLNVNHSVTRIEVAADQKSLICFGKKNQELDLATNELMD